MLYDTVCVEDGGVGARPAAERKEIVVNSEEIFVYDRDFRDFFTQTTRGTFQDGSILIYDVSISVPWVIKKSIGHLKWAFRLTDDFEEKHSNLKLRDYINT